MMASSAEPKYLPAGLTQYIHAQQLLHEILPVPTTALCEKLWMTWMMINMYVDAGFPPVFTILEYTWYIYICIYILRIYLFLFLFFAF